jgi:uncharacterized membrane protein YraQ (UPF0718 family)
LHGKAKSVYDITKMKQDTNPSEENFCDWLGLNVPDEACKFELNCDNKELACLGPGFTLYFEFKKYLLIATAILGGIVGLVSQALIVSAYNDYKDEEFYEL